MSTLAWKKKNQSSQHYFEPQLSSFEIPLQVSEAPLFQQIHHFLCSNLSKMANTVLRRGKNWHFRKLKRNHSSTYFCNFSLNSYSVTNITMDLKHWTTVNDGSTLSDFVVSWFAAINKRPNRCLLIPGTNYVPVQNCFSTRAIQIQVFDLVSLWLPVDNWIAK